jgi:flagella basal body P-ring formation protein FlgA
MRSTFVAAALAACLIPAAAEAQAFQNLDTVDRQVAAFLGQSADSAGATFVPVDRRLRLASCGTPLSLSWYGARQDSVLVRCPDAGGWRVFVRVQGAIAPAAAAVSAPAVARGDAVTVTLRGAGFSVSQSGEAMENGTVGQWIRIRMNKTSEMRAQVLQPGNVTVEMQ